MTDKPSRRGFLGTSMAAGLFVPAWLAGCEKKGDGAAAAPAGESEADKEKHDAGLLVTGIELEQAAIKVYTAAAGLPFIKSQAAVLKVAGLFMGQHKEHRDTLNGWLKKLGGKEHDYSKVKMPDLPKDITDESLDEGKRRAAVLAFARKLEKQAADAYFGLVTKHARTDFVRKGAASILPVEAQHVAVYDLVMGKASPVSAALFDQQT